MFDSLKLGFTRCYLIKCSGGRLMIDTSYPGYFRSFQRRLRKLGREAAEIKYLLLTHHHDKHAGFAAELVKRTGCRVIVHRHGAAPLAHGRPFSAREVAPRPA